MSAIIRHHIINSTALYPPFHSQVLVADDSNELCLRVINENAVRICDARVIKEGILLRNGVVHVIDAVVVSPNMTLPIHKQEHTMPQPPNLVPAMQTGNKRAAQEQPCAHNVSLNATQQQCPAGDSVCSVVNMEWRRCHTQLNSLTARQRRECDGVMKSNATTTLRCFNPATHVCVNDFLCPVSHSQLCGVECFSPSEYECYAEYTLCPADAPNLCGRDCYNATQYECDHGRIIDIHANNRTL